jgi:hypothetical protein
MSKTAELIELAQKEAQAKPGELWCQPCGVKPNVRGVEELPDGTLRHKPCGQSLELVETPPAKPKRPRKAPRKAKKPVRKAKRAKPAPVEHKATPRSLHALGPLLHEVEQLGARRDLAVTVSWRGNSVTIRIAPLEA